MIALILAAHAGLFDELEDCTNQGAYGIAGTAGYANGLEALRVQAATYSASSFAERSLFPHAPAKGSVGIVAIYENNQAYNVARVPTWDTESGCPDEYRFATRPLDLSAANVGLAFRYGRFSGFYSAGSIYGATGEYTQITRMPASFVVPLITGYALGLSGVLGSRQIVNGTTAVAIDAMGGVAVDLTLIEVRAAWAASQGVYLSASQNKIGLFGNALVKSTEAGADVPQAEGGAKRVRWGDASDVIGRTSVWGRQLPLAESAKALARGESVDLITGHLEQTDIAGRYDLGFTLAKEPEPGLYEAHVGVHTPGYYDFITDEAPEQGYFLARAGIVQMPTQWYYGLPGGLYVQGRVDMVAPFGQSKRSAGTFSVMINDVETLSLFPFAANSVAWRMSIRGAW